MNNEINDEQKIITLSREIGDCWNRTSEQHHGNDPNTAVLIETAKKEMFQKIEELLKIDYDQVQKERLVKKLFEKLNENVIKLITEEAEFAEDEKQIIYSVEKLREALTRYKEGKLSWDHYTIQTDVRLPTIILSNMIYKEININVGIEKMNEQIKLLLGQIEKEKYK